MAIKTSTGKTGIGWKILLFIAGIALILLCLKGMALTFFGTSTTAEITETFVKYNDTDSDSKRNVSERKTVITQYYKFTVDGKEYKGSHQVSKKNKVNGVYRVDQQFIDEKKAQTSIKVKYMAFWPKLNSAEEAAKPGLGTALYGLGGLLGIFLLILAFKPKKKASAQTEPAAPPAGEMPAQVCPYCGTPVSGPFCPTCGAKLGE